jgi:hypothetical protein
VNKKFKDLPKELREKLPEYKEKAYRDFLSKLASSNGVKFTPSNCENQRSFHYKYMMGKGNNTFLVAMCLKQRFWWTKGDWEDSNFVWTQWRCKKIIDKITVKP